MGGNYHDNNGGCYQEKVCLHCLFTTLQSILGTLADFVELISANATIEAAKKLPM